MSYLLDTNVLSFFFQAQRQSELAAAARHAPIAIVDEVRRETQADRKYGGLFKKWLPASGILVHEIVVGSEGFATLADLVPDPSRPKDRGERASIALAATDAAMVLVTHDKNAMWLALHELWMPGERLLGLIPFLRRHVGEAQLDASTVDDVVRAAVPRLPTWWASWRAGLAAPASERDGDRAQDDEEDA